MLPWISAASKTPYPKYFEQSYPCLFSTCVFLLSLFNVVFNLGNLRVFDHIFLLVPTYTSCFYWTTLLSCPSNARACLNCLRIINGINNNNNNITNNNNNLIFPQSQTTGASIVLNWRYSFYPVPYPGVTICFFEWQHRQLTGNHH